MGTGRGKSAGGRPFLPSPAADYNVSGDVLPESACNYFVAGVHNGFPYYRREDGAWFLWQHAIDLYLITEVLGVVPPRGWNRIHEDIEGDYNPYGGIVGVATVSAGSH